MTGFLQEGGCHCGALRYKLTKPPLRTLVCHCTDCQRISGSAFGISVVIKDNDRIEIYDTGNRCIFGVVQAQSIHQTLTFKSQDGLVRVKDLPKVEI